MCTQRTAQVVNFWLLHNGFSIGIGDTIADKLTMDAIENFITTAKAEVEQTIAEAHADRLEPLPGMTIRESFESKVNSSLNTARDSAGKSAEQSLKDDNNVKQMVVAGSKGCKHVLLTLPSQNVGSLLSQRSLTSHKCRPVLDSKMLKASAYRLGSNIAPCPILPRMITARSRVALWKIRISGA